MARIVLSSSSHLRCEDYFRIKTPQSTKWIELETYYAGIHSKNKNVSFNHIMLNKCKFSYRNKEYRYTDLDSVEANNLSLTSFSKEAKEAVGFACTNRKTGYLIQVLDTLDRYIQKARFETIKAARILDLDYLNSDSHPKSYSWYYLQRCYNAENAIYSYYSVYEILALLVQISKNWYEKEDTFEQICKKCHSNEVQAKLKRNDGNLYSCFSNGNGGVNEKFMKVRDWCNAFKHRGTLRYDGEAYTTTITTTFIATPEGQESGYDNFSSGDWKPKYIDLDNEVIPALVQYHKDIVELAQYVFQEYVEKEVNHGTSKI